MCWLFLCSTHFHHWAVSPSLLSLQRLYIRDIGLALAVQMFPPLSLQLLAGSFSSVEKSLLFLACESTGLFLSLYFKLYSLSFVGPVKPLIFFLSYNNLRSMFLERMNVALSLGVGQNPGRCLVKYCCFHLSGLVGHCVSGYLGFKLDFSFRQRRFTYIHPSLLAEAFNLLI